MRRFANDEYIVTLYSSDPLAHLQHQAFGSHAIVDADFDRFDDEETFLHRDGRLAPIYGASDAI